MQEQNGMPSGAVAVREETQKGDGESVVVTTTEDGGEVELVATNENSQTNSENQNPEELQKTKLLITEISIQSQEKLTQFLDEWETLKEPENKPSNDDVVDLLNKIDKQLEEIQKEKDFILENLSDEAKAEVFDFIDNSDNGDNDEDSEETNVDQEKTLGDVTLSLNFLRTTILDSDLVSNDLKELYKGEVSESQETSQSLLDKVNIFLEDGLSEGSFFVKQSDNLVKLLNNFLLKDDLDKSLSKKLKKAKRELMELKVAFVKQYFSEELLKTDNIDDLANNLIDLATEDEDVKESLKLVIKALLEANKDNLEEREKLESEFEEQIANASSSDEKEKLKKLKNIVMFLGAFGLNNFYKNGGGSLALFFEFLIHPSGGTYTEGSFGGESSEILTHNSFVEEMQNSSKVGQALFLLVDNSENQQIKSWKIDNLKELDTIKTGEDKQKTSELLVSIYKDVLSGNDDEFEEFINGFSSLLGGKENLQVEESAKKYFKSLLKDDGKKLNKLWELEGDDQDVVDESIVDTNKDKTEVVEDNDN